MTVTSLSQSRNGAKPTNGARPPARVVPLLGPQIDHLLELRALIRRAQDEERQMTAEIVRVMEGAGQMRLVGRQAVAIIDQRTTLRPDPQLFVEALGPTAWEAVSVRVEAARRMMATGDLEAISDSTTSPVLRVEAIHQDPPCAA